MITNELMRHLLTDIPDADRRHLVEVVDRNHAEQLARKRHSREPVPGEALEVFHDPAWDDELD